MWYAFGAYNSETLYGWTRDPEVAKAALARLNQGREINLYGMEELGDDTDEFDLYGDGRMVNLAEWSGLLFDDDTRLEDIEDEES